MRRREFLSGAALTTVAAASAAEAATDPVARSGVRRPTDPVVPKVTRQKAVFPLGAIALLDGPIASQRDANRRYLLRLEPDRLLSCYREQAGLLPKAPPYRGWESEGLKLWGHILGFYLSGAGYMVQSTGDPELAGRLDYITDELHAVQEAHGSGYLLAVPEGKSLFRDIAAGRFEVDNPGGKYAAFINGVFEPTYTWNKVTLGLHQSYLATGNARTRAVLLRTADWLGHDVLDRLSDAQVQKLLYCEHGSIHESMLAAFQLTGEIRYRHWARRLCYDRMLRPLAAGDGAFLDGYHANCSIPVYTGAERIYQHTGETYLHRAAVNFTDEVVRRRSWVIGGNSAQEHFFPYDEFEAKVHEPAGPETCNSVNMLRLIEAVYETDPRPELVDHYERILWNHLMAAHDPDRCMTAYYTPLRPGSYRPYADEFDSMWCCVGTGLECPGKYGQMIYSRDLVADGVDVNLFVASRLDWEERGLSIKQETRFPDEASSTLTITAAPSTSLPIRIRHPRWIPAGQMRLVLNGSPIGTASRPSEYATVSRVWQVGDRLEIALPMQIEIEPLPGSRAYAAILYGPIVLSGAHGSPDVKRREYWKLTEQLADIKIDEAKFPVLSVSSERVPAMVERVAGKPLSFRFMDGAASSPDVRLEPFFRNHFQQYTVYWRTTHTA